MWVTDQGNIVIAATGPLYSYLVVLSCDGEERLRIAMLSAKEEYDGCAYRSRFIVQALGATLWDYQALSGIYTFEGKEHYFITFLWGDSILVEIASGRWLENAPPSTPGLLEAEEKTCLQWLFSGEDLDIHAALAAVARRPFSKAVAALRSLELREKPDEFKGESNTFYLTHESEHGLLLRLALRRCGELPAGNPAYTFQSDGEVLSVSDESERDQLFNDAPGELRWREALRLYGAPDFIGCHFEKTGKRYQKAETWGYLLGLSDEMSVARLYWQPDSRGDSLQRFEITNLESTKIGEFLANQLLRRG